MTINYSYPTKVFPSPSPSITITTIPHLSRVLGLGVVKAICRGQISNRQTVSINRGLERSSSVVVGDVGVGHSGVDEGQDATERLGRRQSCVAAEGGDVTGFEALLGADRAAAMIAPSSPSWSTMVSARTSRNGRLASSLLTHCLSRVGT